MLTSKERFANLMVGDTVYKRESIARAKMEAEAKATNGNQNEKEKKKSKTKLTLSKINPISRMSGTSPRRSGGKRA